MVGAVAHYGYAEASVARILSIAGVSRATFYEHFGSREDAFRHAYRGLVATLREEIVTALVQSPPDRRLGVLLGQLCHSLAADPAAARVLLVEVRAAPPAARREHDHLVASAQALVVSLLGEQATRPPIQIPAAALFGGASQLLAWRVLEGRLGELDRLRSQLAHWLESYRLPRGERPLSQARWNELGRFGRPAAVREGHPPTLLPRGRSALSPRQAADARRLRILDATARIVANQGYAALTVAGVAASARVPRSAFYSLFKGKQEALLAAQAQLIGGAMAHAAAAYSVVAPWPQRLRLAVDAYLRHLAEYPEYARLAFLASDAAGAAAIAHRYRAQAAFAIFFEGGYGDAGGTSSTRICSEASAAAAFALIRAEIRDGEPERLTAASPAVAYVCLAPFIGAARSLELVAAREPTAR